MKGFSIRTVCNGVRQVRHRLELQGTRTRLRKHPHPAAPRLADVLDDWRAGRPLDDDLLPRIERRRNAWLNEPDDSPANQAFDDKRTIADACRASKKPIMAELLYRLAREFQPGTGIEFGTNVGISSSYIAAALRDGGGRLVTLEGSPGRLALARALHAELALQNIDYQLGRFRKTLPKVLAEIPSIELAFIDGHHHRDPTLEYFDAIYPHLADGALVVFDDIRWSAGMCEAWKVLKTDRRFSFLVDIVSIGIGVVTRSSAADAPDVFRWPSTIRKT